MKVTDIATEYLPALDSYSVVNSILHNENLIVPSSERAWVFLCERDI